MEDAVPTSLVVHIRGVTAFVDTQHAGKYWQGRVALRVGRNASRIDHVCVRLAQSKEEAALHACKDAEWLIQGALEN